MADPETGKDPQRRISIPGARTILGVVGLFLLTIAILIIIRFTLLK